MEQEHFIGPMAGNIMDLGKMGSNTAEDNIIQHQDKKKQENGLKEKE